MGERQSPRGYDAAIGASWVGLALFIVATVVAFAGEMFTRFADPGPGYYLIMIGMPAYCVGWLYLLLYASFRDVPSRWLFAGLSAALLLVLAANIG